MSKSAKGGSSGGGSGGSSGKSGSLIAGILLGMVLGLAAAGGVAWYIVKKNPASFEHRETPKPEAENKIVSPPASAPAPVSDNVPSAASEVSPTAKQHFEFYKVLTDKPDGTAQKGSEKSTAKETHAAQQAKSAQAASTKEIFYVQAGSYPNEDSAEKLKAKLALLGLEASLQTAVIPDRGTYHRVRLGPFNSSSDVNKVLALLKQNGVENATSIKVQ
jgi:cell division protein FtsN